MLDVSGESTIVRLAIFVGIGALSLTLLFLLLAIWVRGLITRRGDRRRRVEDAWFPLMLRALREAVVEPPRLRRRDRAPVLALWNRLAAGIEGEAVNRLRDFARAAGFEEAARHVVATGAPAERLVGATFLGVQQDLGGVPSLMDLTAAAPLVVRAEAARALIRIDPEAGPGTVVPLVARWDDCHPAVAVAVLKDAPAHVVSVAVAEEAIGATEAPRQARLVELLGTIRGPAGLEAVRRILPTSADAEVVSKCLAVIREHRRPEDAELVRPFLHHPAAFVRVQAVAALGRLQGEGDEWRVAACLGDSDWWVRHRAAGALVASPRVSLRFVRLLAAVHPDRYARGAIQQALSEAEPAR